MLRTQRLDRQKNGGILTFNAIYTILVSIRQYNGDVCTAVAHWSAQDSAGRASHSAGRGPQGRAKPYRLTGGSKSDEFMRICNMAALIQRMKKILVDKKGVGLAAPQIGVNLQVRF